MAYPRPNRGGRPKKVTDPVAIANHWISVKAREPEVTQKEFAAHYKISDRSLRRCLKYLADQKQKKGPGLILGDSGSAKSDKSEQAEPRKTGMMIFWT